jgi:hypothetical protein
MAKVHAQGAHRVAVTQRARHTPALRPRVLKLGHMVTRFPHLHALALTQCSNIRNRDFYVLGRAGLRLQALALGDDSSKPW